MKVQALIEKLQTLDPEKEIFIEISDTEFYTDFSFNVTSEDFQTGKLVRKVGWYKEVEDGDIEFYAIPVWL